MPESGEKPYPQQPHTHTRIPASCLASYRWPPVLLPTPPDGINFLMPSSGLLPGPLGMAAQATSSLTHLARVPPSTALGRSARTLTFSTPAQPCPPSDLLTLFLPPLTLGKSQMPLLPRSRPSLDCKAAVLYPFPLRLSASDDARPSVPSLRAPRAQLPVIWGALIPPPTRALSVARSVDSPLQLPTLPHTVSFLLLLHCHKLNGLKQRRVFTLHFWKSGV